ncbi:DUF2637 domain-containing protein [Streptomyces echinatus]|uniref:DUF2637 domain-containing protein n=1 Tax=Streptomyces echinatus TaxID=67293 RepID=UPI00355734F1
MTSPSPAPHPADRYTLLAAGAVILALTAAGFWLSYAHLADVAGEHGLGDSPARKWAWPATLDAFIVAGELLMLRAGLRRKPDGWAIALTATGSLGSIALNVAGVTGTRAPTDVPRLDCVVAAVPPTAALLAFGVLMRQIHQHLAPPTHEADHGDLRAAGPAATEHPREGDRLRPHPVPAPSAAETEHARHDSERVGRIVFSGACPPPSPVPPPTGSGPLPRLPWAGAARTTRPARPSPAAGPGSGRTPGVRPWPRSRTTGRPPGSPSRTPRTGCPARGCLRCRRPTC